MEIKMLKLAELVPYEKNPRKNDEAVKYVAASIKEFGFKEDIAVIENKYIVTPSGKVYTIHYNKKGIKEQKLRTHTNGYLRATLFGKDFYVHRLVAFCFIENPNGYSEISHEDNNKKNNSVENLKWCDRQYNNSKMFIDGIKTNEDMKKIAKMPKVKSRRFSVEQVNDIKEKISAGYSDTVLAKEYGCARGVIYQIRKGIAYKEAV